MTEVVILPGFDGAAALREQFRSCLERHGVATRAIAYPTDMPLGYDDLEPLVRAQLPSNTDFVLLGESFSGPLAIRLSVNPPAGLRGLVLSTTFARSPMPQLRPLAGLTRFAPVRLPMVLLSWWLFGRWATPELQETLGKTLESVSPAVLRFRAAAVLRVDVSTLLASVQVPALNLVAIHDRLLTSSVAQGLAAGLPHCRTVRIAGPHLLLQAAPEPCAQAIASFVLGLNSNNPFKPRAGSIKP